YTVDPVLFRWSRERLWRLPKRRLKRFRVFKGHMKFGLHEVLPQPATYITVLRDPIDRMISAFYFMHTYKLHPNYWKFRREGWTLEDFVKRWPKANLQTKMIAGADYDAPCTAEILRKAKENLQYFSVVGLTERFEETLALMKVRFGWKLQSYSSFNVTRTRPKKRDLPQSTLDLIAERNRFDIELYDCVAKIFEDAISQNAAEISHVLCELEAARIQDSLRLALFSVRAATRKAINRLYSAL
ncbi:MAG: sulfotransferase family 2 domain-containing protein, partial [Bryobacteraceae bacterium]